VTRPRLGRALVPAAAAALLLAAPAAAVLPLIPSGSAVGDGVPLKAYASVSPTVHLFGDDLTARVAVVADTKWVKPLRLRVTAHFEPYTLVRRPTVLRLGDGRFMQMTWTWTLRCLTAQCIPSAPPSDKYRVFRFRAAHVDYLDAKGRRTFGITASFPKVEVLSQVSPGVADFLSRHNSLNWQYKLTPVGSPAYRVSPSLAFWGSLGLAAALAAAGLAVLGRWLLSFRRPSVAVPGTGSALDRALAVFFWARELGDETLQRKALERVADELETDGRELSEVARALAWSPGTPEDEDVQAISDRAHDPAQEQAR
jgi:hypothetical protein